MLLARLEVGSWAGYTMICLYWQVPMVEKSIHVLVCKLIWNGECVQIGFGHPIKLQAWWKQKSNSHNLPWWGQRKLTGGDSPQTLAICRMSFTQGSYFSCQPVAVGTFCYSTGEDLLSQGTKANEDIRGGLHNLLLTKWMGLVHEVALIHRLVLWEPIYTIKRAVSELFIALMRNRRGINLG